MTLERKKLNKNDKRKDGGAVGQGKADQII